MSSTRLCRPLDLGHAAIPQGRRSAPGQGARGRCAHGVRLAIAATLVPSHLEGERGYHATSAEPAIALSGAARRSPHHALEEMTMPSMLIWLPLKPGQT